MNASTSSNPLGAAQPNRSGAQTFGKYEYQYHWALCKIIDRHLKERDYVIFIEFHEDVLYSTSSIESEANFEFTQVKDFSGAAWDHKKITNIPKGKKNSVLGKIFDGIKGKPFESRISSLELTATPGFKLKQKDEKLKLSIFRLEDIHDDCIKEIESILEKEIGKIVLPANLIFTKPDLIPGSVRAEAIAKISGLISATNPGVFYDPVSIYRVLIDDLHIKGQIDYDFSQWKKLIETKGTTYNDVSGVIKNYTNKNTLEDFKPYLDDFFGDLQIASNKKTKIRQAFARYHTATKLNRDISDLEKKKAISEIVNNQYFIYSEDGLEAFIKICKPYLEALDFYKFTDETTMLAELFYELSAKCHE